MVMPLRGYPYTRARIIIDRCFLDRHSDSMGRGGNPERKGTTQLWSVKPCLHAPHVLGDFYANEAGIRRRSAVETVFAIIVWATAEEAPCITDGCCLFDRLHASSPVPPSPCL